MTVLQERTKERIRERIREAAADAPGGLRVISLDATNRIAIDLGARRREVEVAALDLEILPTRYLRSFGTVGLAGQRRLLESSVVVVGAGGLGGYVIEGLARMGVGTIHVVDGDVFQDHNLNRQLLCDESSIGKCKALTAVERARLVNGAVEVIAHECFLDEENADILVAPAEVVVDALDSIPTRLLLQEATARRGVPLVHGAIAGYYAQVMTIFPGDPGLFRFYRKDAAPERGIETRLGNPAATPMLCAALQVHEVVKYLVGAGLPLRDRMMIVDAGEAVAEIVDLGARP